MAKRLSPGTDPVDDTERGPRCRVLLEASLVDCLLPALHRAAVGVLPHAPAPSPMKGEREEEGTRPVSPAPSMGEGAGG